MSLFDVITLFLIMASLAAIPSTSVALVLARSATAGVRAGVAVSAGIVLGDLVFVVLSMLGLSIIAEAMSNLFMVIKYLGAMYLLWFGFSLIVKADSIVSLADSHRERGGFVESFLSGFALTLGDIKAIYFYMSLFPTFVPLGKIQMADILTIVFVTIASVGGVKIIYALSASKLASLSKGSNLESASKKAAGCIMMGAGGLILAKA